MIELRPELPGNPGGAGQSGVRADLRATLAGRFRRIRSVTGALAARLTVEDQQVQSSPETSPVKWHLAHTSWFLERHVLERLVPGYRAYDDRYAYIFNDQASHGGTCLPAAQRGVLSRPSHDEVSRYRDHVNAAVLRLVMDCPDEAWTQVARLVELALQHEQQHQELVLADVKHALWSNPMQPAYQAPVPTPLQTSAGQSWFDHPGGLAAVGHEGPGFAFDFERPRHKVVVEPFRFAGRLVTCGEYMEFMEDGGYDTPSLWLADGWAAVQAGGWRSPLYWQKLGGLWHQFTLAGLKLVDEEEPVVHVSFFEAAAFARWAGKRLPTEVEWELVAEGRRRTGNLLEYGRLHPGTVACAGEGPWQLYGDAWEWTSSPMQPYPRYAPSDLAVGCYADLPPATDRVLRGGSCATPGDLVRATYRHHLGPTARWHFTGIRLAQDA
ncbi:MAG TPA: ergothioneine biosynthesis protein EgtB [Azospirillaceae bacterium]|nr:ergothioneine biosynthesis protein EgtB [Azospirillaceae bacterium]